MKQHFKRSLLASVIALSLPLTLAQAAISSQPSSQALWLNSSLNSSTATHAWELASAKLITDAKSRMKLALPVIRSAANSNDTADYVMQKSRVMSPKLAAKYPNIQSFELQHGSDIGYVVLTENAMHGAYQINGQWHDIATAFDDSENTITIRPSFDNQQEAKQALQSIEALNQELFNAVLPQGATLQADTGGTLTTYRLAVSASGEYTTRLGGSVESALAGIVTLFTRVNQVVEKDLAITFELVANTDQLIFLDADTDPFSNDNASADLDANQIEIDTTIGSANYDIGHLVNTNGGGLAGLGALCISNFKAKGYTGSRNPIGERFVVDLLLHEVGHQLGGEHSFNATESNCAGGNRSRNGRSSVEVGSGTTIMSYAGICGSQNITNVSTPHFHGFSVRQMRQTIDARNCGTDTDLANTPPTITLESDSYNIPANTPFLLNATVVDAEQSELENIWEQVDPGGNFGGTATIQEARIDNGDNPLFRSFEPIAETYRYFPRFDSIVSGTLINGEVYPDTNRELTMRIMSRDQASGVASEDVSINVVKTSAAFTLNSQGSNETWLSSSQQTLEWETGDSELAPINCATVDVLIDTDQDNLFDLEIASDISNTGSAEISAPNLNLDFSRLMLKCSDNVFFAISDGLITFVSNEDIMPIITGQADDIAVSEDTSFTISLSDLLVNDGDSNYPDDFTLAVLDGDNYATTGASITPSLDYSGELSVGVQVNDGGLDSNVFDLAISVTPVNDAPVITGQTELSVNEDESIVVNVSNLEVSDVDSGQNELSLIVASGANYSFSSSTIIPSPDFSGTLSVNVTVTDGSDISEPFSLNIDVENINDAPVAQNDQLSVVQGAAATSISVLANDSDADTGVGDVISVISTSYSGQGTVSFTNSTVSYQPAASFSGSETVSYTISDTAGEEATATINIVVTPEAAPPSSGGGSDSGSGGSLPLSLIALMSAMAFIRRSYATH